MDWTPSGPGVGKQLLHLAASVAPKLTQLYRLSNNSVQCTGCPTTNRLAEQKESCHQSRQLGFLSFDIIKGFLYVQFVLLVTEIDVGICYLLSGC